MDARIVPCCISFPLLYNKLPQTYQLKTKHLFNSPFCKSEVRDGVAEFSAQGLTTLHAKSAGFVLILSLASPHNSWYWQKLVPCSCSREVPIVLLAIIDGKAIT